MLAENSGEWEFSKWRSEIITSKSKEQCQKHLTYNSEVTDTRWWPFLFLEIFTLDVTPISQNPKELEAEEKPQKSLDEKQQVCFFLTTLFVPPLFRKIMHQLWFDHYNSCDFISSYMNFVLQENQDLLIKCVSQDLGFSSGKPIAACLIYRCLLHWRSFEVERTGVFDRIIQTIGSAIEVMNCACLFDFTPFFS